MQDVQAVAVRPTSVMRDMVVLTKPRLSSLVLCTTAGGIWLAPGPLSLPRALLVLVATALLVGGAQALNSYLERDVDALMQRTKSRPLAAQRLDAKVGFWLGVTLALVSLPVLLVAGNLVTALLGMSAFVSYVAIYTPLKRHSTLALLVGAVPGALPPAMGYTSVTGHFDFVALTLFGILFVWQLPHFLAISIYLRDDYALGGLKVFALVHGERAAKWAIAGTALLLIPVSYALVPLGVANQTYGVVSALLGAAFFVLCLTGLGQATDSRWARSTFLGSLAYLTLLFAALAVGAS